MTPSVDRIARGGALGPAPFDGIAELADGLGEAEAAGLLAPEAASAREFDSAPERIRAVRKALHLLGYLPEDSRAETADDELRHALRALQMDAGVTVDGWAGAQTWGVLEALFCFEPALDPAPWCARPRCAPLLQRAAQRRLLALGFAPPPPHEQLVDLRPYLRRFGDLALSIGLCAQVPEPELQAPMLRILFDQDGIADALARQDASEEPQGDRRALIVCAAKVELWLLGYETNPDGDASFIVPALPLRRPGRGGGGFSATEADPPLFAGLRRFWDDHGRDRLGLRPARDYAVGFLREYPRFFAATRTLASEGEPEPDRLAQVLEESGRDRERQLRRAWQGRVRTIGGRIWDGLRRVWGWIRRLARTAAELITNLVRAAYRLAGEAFTVARAAVRAFPAAVRVLTQREAEGSDGRWAQWRDRDFDQTVWVSPGTGPALVAGRTAAHARRLESFSFCCRVVGLVLGLLRTVLAAGATGWVALASALVRASRHMSRFRDYWLAHREELLAAGD